MVSPPYTAGYGASYVQAAAPDGETVVFASLGTFAEAPSSHVGFASGSSYVATRTPSGWSTAPLALPAWIAPYDSPPLVDLSANVGQALFYGLSGANAGQAQLKSPEGAFFLHSTHAPDPLGEFTLAGETLKPLKGTQKFSLSNKGGSADLSHVIFGGGAEGEPLTAEGAGYDTHAWTYDLVTDGSEPYVLRLLALDNKAKPKPLEPGCLAEIGAGVLDGNVRTGLVDGNKASAASALARDGRVLFFTAATAAECSQQVNESRMVPEGQLFVRLDGQKTLEVSRPLEAGPFGGCVGESVSVRGEVPCRGAATRGPAEYAGASADGSKVFFLTAAQLAPGDNDHGVDLYVATLGCPTSEPGCEVSKWEVTSLTQASHGTAGPADVRGVVTIGADGSYAYFVARGVLSGENPGGTSPVAGADNLYAYNSVTGGVSFVADLCTDGSTSGAQPDVHCPADVGLLRDTHDGNFEKMTDERLWAGTTPQAQTADGGHFLLFSSRGQLTPDDTDDASDIYRYDAQSGTLERVSLGEGGYGANGNMNDEGVETNADAGISQFAASEVQSEVQAMLGTRAMSEDGSRIVFMTEEPLSPHAINGFTDAYEWHDGKVSLVSSGEAEDSVLEPGEEDVLVITPSGNDIFFTTVQKLLSQDTNEDQDVYDARLGSGFPAPVAPAQPCSPGACQGPPTNPAPLLIPGSASQLAGENLPVATAKGKATQRKKRPRKHRRKSARHARRKQAKVKRTSRVGRRKA
jgi:hypothetical protein